MRALRPLVVMRKPPHAASAKPNTTVTSSEFAYGIGPSPGGHTREGLTTAYLPGRHPTSSNRKSYAAGKSSLFRASSLYSDMTYSKAAPIRSTQDAVGSNGHALSWFVPPIVVPALLAALLLAWIAYQAYS